MNYKFELKLAITNANVDILDRNKNLLLTTHSVDNGIHTYEVMISLPNRILVQVTPAQENNFSVELKGAALGQIKFNNSLLDKIFTYRTEHGDDKSLIWVSKGTAEFEFFDHDPITYHLNIGTTI